MRKSWFTVILVLGAFLFGCGEAPETPEERDKPEKPEERDKRLSTAAAGTSVNCSYKVFTWMVPPPEMNAGPPSASLRIDYYDFSNEKLHGFPDGNYEIGIDGTYTNGGFVLEEPYEIKYTKKGTNFELPRAWFTARILTKDQIESFGFQGAIGQQPPRGEFSCVIHDVKFLG